MRTNETGRARKHDPIRPSDSESLVGIVPPGGAADTQRRIIIDRPRKRPERIYITSPVSTYRERRYDVAVAAIGARFPSSKLIVARNLWTDSADWLRRWPDILHTLDRLVYFLAADRTIGAGVAREVADAYALGLPVCLLDGGRLRDHSRVRWRWLAPGNRARVAFVPRIEATGAPQGDLCGAG
jgi:hypothetical protein